MRFLAMTVAVLLMMMTGGCSKTKKQKRREATLAKLAKTDCKAIAAKAKRCDSAVRKAADEKQRKTGKKHLSMMVTLGLAAFKDLSRCQKYVRLRVRFLRKSCKKYASAADFCRTAQRKYLQGLETINKCFASNDCNQIATCYVENFLATQP
jgi:hypothetical protein